MDSLATIINDLKNIATGMNYTGPTVDALIYLMANGIQKNNLNSTVAVLEASNTRCRLLNSAIQHAKDLGYSVNRGRNQHIVIHNLQVIESKTVKKFDQAAKIGNYYLFFASNQILKSNELIDIDFIVGKAPIQETLTVENQLNLLRLNTTATNLSSEIEIQDEFGETLNHSEDRHEIFTDLNKQLWVATSTDYSIEIYNYSHNADRVDLANESQETKLDNWVYFNPGSFYTIKSVAYTPDTVDLSAIKSIPGFKMPPNPLENIKSWEPIEKEDDILQIYLNSQEISDSSFVLRASKDLENGIPASVKDTPIKYTNSSFYYFAGLEYPTQNWTYDQVDWPTPVAFDTEDNANYDIYIEHETWITDTLLEGFPASFQNLLKPQKHAIPGSDPIRYDYSEFKTDAFREAYRTFIYPLMSHNPDTGLSNKRFPLLLVYYLTEQNSYLQATEEAQVIEYLQRVYFVTQSVCCIRAIPHEPFKFYIRVYYTQTLDVSELKDFIENYSTHIGEAYDPNLIIGELIKKYPGIHHISFYTPPGLSDPDRERVEIAPCQYLTFNINIDQQPYVES